MPPHLWLLFFLMCYFLTVAVPGRHAAAFTNAIPRGMCAHSTQNPSLTQYLQGFQGFLLTTGMCSCDLYHPPPADHASDVDQRRKKYEKLGWSVAKIQRALAAAETHAQHSAKPDFVGLRPDTRQFLARIINEVRDLAIAVHFFGGDVETCRYSLKSGPVLSPDEFSEGTISFAEDTLIRIRAVK